MSGRLLKCADRRGLDGRPSRAGVDKGPMGIVRRGGSGDSPDLLGRDGGHSSWAPPPRPVQDKMQAFRETIAKGVTDPFSVVLKSSKLPISLLKDTEGKTSRMDLLSIQPFQETFSKKRQQKRVKLGTYDLEGLLESVDKKNEGYDGKKERPWFALLSVCLIRQAVIIV